MKWKNNFFDLTEVYIKEKLERKFFASYFERIRSGVNVTDLLYRNPDPNCVGLSDFNLPLFFRTCRNKMGATK